jgi:hypothetical protein
MALPRAGGGWARGDAHLSEDGNGGILPQAYDGFA